MTNQHSFVSSDRFDRDLKTAERVLNGAIVQAEITESFEEYLEIFDALRDGKDVRGHIEIVLRFAAPLMVIAVSCSPIRYVRGRRLTEAARRLANGAPDRALMR